MKQMITASTSRAFNSSAAARTSSSSSGTSMRPSGGKMRSVTGMRLRRLTRGLDCHGRSNCIEKLCGRLWRAMWMMSR